MPEPPLRPPLHPVVQTAPRTPRCRRGYRPPRPPSTGSRESASVYGSSPPVANRRDSSDDPAAFRRVRQLPKKGRRNGPPPGDQEPYGAGSARILTGSGPGDDLLHGGGDDDTLTRPFRGRRSDPSDDMIHPCFAGRAVGRANLRPNLPTFLTRGA